MKKLFILFTLIGCNLQAMESGATPKVSSEIIECSHSLSQALRKSLKHEIEKNIVYYNPWDDEAHNYKQCSRDIAEHFNAPNNTSKPYVLSCAVYLEDQLSCNIFDTKEQKWIFGQKIQRDLEDPGRYFPTTHRILDAQCAVINIDGFYVPMDLCYGLAQALKSKNIPVVFNVQKRLLGNDDIGKKSTWLEFLDSLSVRIERNIPYTIIDTRPQEEKIISDSENTENIQVIKPYSFIIPIRIGIGCLIIAMSIFCLKKLYK